MSAITAIESLGLDTENQFVELPNYTETLDFDQYTATLKTVENIKMWQKAVVFGCAVLTAAGVAIVSAERSNICIEPTAADYQAVDTALHDDSIPLLRTYHHRKTGPQRLARHNLQDKLGLIKPEFDASVPAEQRDTIDGLRTYAKLFGVDVQIESTTANEIPTTAELASPEAKKVIGDIEGELVKSSVQFVQAAGFDKIVLYSNKHGSDPAALDYASVSRNGDNGIHDDVSSGDEGNAHEAGHFMDRAACGPRGMLDDPAYRALNGPVNIYTQTWPPRPLTDSEKELSLGHYEKEFKDTRKMLLDANSREVRGLTGPEVDMVVADGLSYDASRVTTASDYGLDYLAEDKADLIKALQDPYMHKEIFDPAKPKLYAKSRLLAARWMHIEPKSATYALMTGTHPIGYEKILANSGATN